VVVVVVVMAVLVVIITVAIQQNFFLYTATDFKFINCIIKYNTLPYSYFPHVLSLHILYIKLQTVKYINCIINCNIVHIHISFIFCNYVSCI